MFSFYKKKDPIPTQTSIHNGAEIFESIKTKLKGAQFSIKIAAAWFTDSELFQILIDKKDQNVDCKIEIVLDDNKENYWLPFMDLAKKGATIKLSKGLGSNGRMHEKFCIIDDSLLISGSYNWSKNARTENHENVIVSEIPSTVREFNQKFSELLISSTMYESQNLQGSEVSKDEALEEISNQESFTRQFEKVLDEMIYSSVVEYDRESLKNRGFERSQKCSGDSNIINNELNTVYTEMLNSISASEQKKEIIKAKVNAHLKDNTTTLVAKCSRNKEQVRIDEDNVIKNYKSEIEFIKDNNHRIKEEVIKLEQSDIINNSNKIKELTEEKLSIEAETVKMPFRWYVDIPSYIALTGVFTYILLFYSSAAYILMFSGRDAKTAKLLGQPVEEFGIYHSNALFNATKNGYSEILLILFVPFFLTCGVIYLKKLKTPSFFPKWAIKLVCLILIDGFTAIAVTKAIHENNYLAGRETEHFKFSNVFADVNLYLVFVFGMLSLLIFDLIVTYILNSFSSRNDVHLNAKKRARIDLLNKEISTLSKINLDNNALLINKKSLIDHNLYTISSIENKIQLEPGLSSRKINLLENETNSQILNLENVVKIAYNKIENELFTFSTHFVKDRINIFLQGWNNFIYSYYSKGISEEKIQEAKVIANAWFQEHFTNGSSLIKNLKNEIVL